jgi:hypothetical protein
VELRGGIDLSLRDAAEPPPSRCSYYIDLTLRDAALAAKAGYAVTAELHEFCAKMAKEKRMKIDSLRRRVGVA